MAFKSIYAPFTKRPHTHDGQDGGSFRPSIILQYNFSIYTWMLIGASLQALAVFLFSRGYYVLLTSTVLLSGKLANTLLQAYGITANPYLEGVIPGRVTALIPEESGEVSTASSKKVVVLHLGAKSNHPFGYFAPQFSKVGEWLTKMNREMDKGNVKGFLGQTTFHRMDTKGAPEVNLISYWESIEDLWAYAHSGSHREAWQWWEKTIKESGYVGINHEIFEADAQHWENIYVNFQPTMMGATTYLVRGGKTAQGVVDDKWVSPLIDARRGPLAKSSGRLGRQITSYDENRVAKVTYA